MTAERDELESTTFSTTIHGTTIRWIATIDHFINVFHLGLSGMECILNFFIVISKQFL